ncbi:MAG TPA: group I intron-associated PD-(D/E)XK endonuclease [Gemmataceae bacterium]|jgi:hypothetical protein
MESPLEWMERDNPHYDPNRIGAVSQAKILAALVAAGKVVLTPCVHVRPYDFVIEEDRSFFRVQCKTGRLFRGAVCFRPHRLRAAKQETGWVRRVTDYKGEVDFFGVFCPETDSVYLVPIEVVNTSKFCFLRVTPPKNNQKKGIRWAEDYLVVPRYSPPMMILDDAIDD